MNGTARRTSISRRFGIPSRIYQARKSDLHQNLVTKSIGKLSDTDAATLKNSSRGWLGLA